MIRRRTCFAGPRDSQAAREDRGADDSFWLADFRHATVATLSTRERMPPKLAKQKFRGFAGALAGMHN